LRILIVIFILSILTSFCHFPFCFVLFFGSFIPVKILFLSLFFISLFIRFLLLFVGFFAGLVRNHLLLIALEFMANYCNLLLAFGLLLFLLVNLLPLLPFIQLFLAFHLESFLILSEQLFPIDVIILVLACILFDLRFLILIT